MDANMSNLIIDEHQQKFLLKNNQKDFFNIYLPAHYFSVAVHHRKTQMSFHLQRRVFPNLNQC